MDGPGCSTNYNIIAPFICSAIIVFFSSLAYCWRQYCKERRDRRERRDPELQRLRWEQHDAQDDFAAFQAKIEQQEKRINSLERENETYKKTCKEQQTHRDQHGLLSFIPTELTDPAELTSVTLNCIFLQFDRTRCNTTRTNITSQGELVNSGDLMSTGEQGGFKNYWGTSSTCPLPWSRSPQYFEVKAKVDITRPLGSSELVLEIALARAEDQDLSYNIQGKPQTYSLNVAHCTIHNTVCRNGWRHRRIMQCLPQTFKNAAGNSSTLHFGVLYDHSRGRVVFLDVGKGKSISVIDGVDTSVLFWPMFGVFCPQRGSVSMSLVVGSDINMTEEKKFMLMKALHERYTEY